MLVVDAMRDLSEDDRKTVLALARALADGQAGFDPTCPSCVRLLASVVSRGTIEQAKGIVMQACGVNADAAFDILRDESQSTNRKIADIAEELVIRADVRARRNVSH